MAKIATWEVDWETRVDLEVNGRLWISQENDLIMLSKNHASPAALIDALLAAMTESGYDMPDLSRHGYRGAAA